MIIKSKLSSNSVYQGYASEMILIQFSLTLNQLLEKGNEEKIGRGFEKDLEMRNRTAGNWKDKERLIYQKNV